MKRALLLAFLAALPACNAILGIDDLSGPGGDDDGGDGGVTDAPTQPPGASTLRAPRLGYTTGSAHADSSLRPRLTWRATPGATSYDLAVDDTCQTSSFRTCGFPSPEVMETGLTDTTFTPASSLAVSLAAPVGRRYFWRVRGCNEHGCGDWSDVWYLDIGRLADDVDGDGYGDLVVGIDTEVGGTTEIGAAYIAFGRPTAGTIRTSLLEDPRDDIDGRFGRTVAMVGDVNADGYGDLLVGAWRTNNNDHLGTAYLYLGRGTWPATVPDPTTAIAVATADASSGFGGALAGRGDMNGDGYGDMAIGAVNVLFGGGGGPVTVPGYAYVNFGRPSWSFSQIGSDLVIPDPRGDVGGYFGSGLAFGDLDEDGRADLVVGAPGASTFAGQTQVYFGDATYPAAPHTVGTADVTMTTDGTGMVLFGFSAAVCGATPDGPALAIGAPFETRPAANAGVTRVYAPRDPWPATITGPADRTLSNPSGSLNGFMGIGVRCADVDADGKDDMIVGAPTGDDTGWVYVYGAVDDLPSNPMTELTSGDPFAGTLGFSVAVTDFNGDGVMDVFGGAPNLGTASQSGRVLGWLGRSVWPAAIMAADITIDNPAGIASQHFGRALD